MSVEADGTVRHEVVVDLPVDQAFLMFADLDRIKPREHNLLNVPIEATVLEPHVGGDIYDRGIDGSVCRWGRVLALDPPRAITFSWDIGPDWQIAADLTRTSEVDVTLCSGGGAPDPRHPRASPHPPTRRRLESVRDGVEAPDGWPLYLARYEALTSGADGP